MSFEQTLAEQLRHHAADLALLQVGLHAGCLEAERAESAHHRHNPDFRRAHAELPAVTHFDKPVGYGGQFVQPVGSQPLKALFDLGLFTSLLFDSVHVCPVEHSLKCVLGEVDRGWNPSPTILLQIRLSAQAGLASLPSAGLLTDPALPANLVRCIRNKPLLHWLPPCTKLSRRAESAQCVRLTLAPTAASVLGGNDPIQPSFQKANVATTCLNGVSFWILAAVSA